jgi:hypothetical protein
MALPSTYHLRHSLPNRSASARPRALSLSEYQPLSFDRESLEAAYQQTLSQPASGYGSTSTLSSFIGPASISVASRSNGSDATHATTPSTLTHHLKRGDNPHRHSQPPPSRPPGEFGQQQQQRQPPNFVGVGAGHSLTPPHSPVHKAVQGWQQQALLTPPAGVVGTPVLPPTPPERPGMLPESTFVPSESPHPGRGNRRDSSAMDVDGEWAGYGGDPGGRGGDRDRGKRRALPSAPTNIPTPVSHACALYIKS